MKITFSSVQCSFFLSLMLSAMKSMKSLFWPNIVKITSDLSVKCMVPKSIRIRTTSVVLVHTEHIKGHEQEILPAKCV